MTLHKIKKCGIWHYIIIFLKVKKVLVHIHIFRKDVDPYEPKLLKYDGTHVVVSIKHMKLNNPVTTTDDHSIKVTPPHRK